MAGGASPPAPCPHLSSRFQNRTVRSLFILHYLTGDLKSLPLLPYQKVGLTASDPELTVAVQVGLGSGVCPSGRPVVLPRSAASQGP